MELKEIIKEVDKIEGWFYSSQMMTLYPIVRELDPTGLIVEIGTYYGRSARFFSLANPKVKVVTIDIVKNPGGAGHPRHPEGGLFIAEEVLSGGNIFQVVGESGKIAKGFNWKIDLLFIDDGHTREAAWRDIKSWTPFVKPEGYVVFHDYCPRHPGVIKAVDEWMENNKEFTKVTSENLLYVVRRNKHA